jgi:hypothetical protein
MRPGQLLDVIASLGPGEHHKSDVIARAEAMGIPWDWDAVDTIVAERPYAVTYAEHCFELHGRTARERIKGKR